MSAAAPRWFAAIVLALGLLAAAAVAGRPVGLGLSVVAVALFAAAAVATPRRDGWCALWWAGAVALAAVPVVREAGWAVWPALVGAVALASLAAAGGATWWQIAIGLVRIGDPRSALDARRHLPAPRAAWRHPAQGAAIAAVLLGVFVPLFASADAAFAHLLAEAVPTDLLDRPVARAGILIAVLAAGAGLLAAGRAGPAGAAAAAEPRLARIEWVLPLGLLVALFAAFVALQITTLFGGHEHVLRTAGLTYAEYAREGFGQLLAAAALTLAVVAGAVRWARRASQSDERLLRALLAALCALALVVLASALMRLGLYEEAYGYTRLRLVAHAQILWLGGVFALVLVALAVRRATAWLPRAVTALSAAAVLLFAIADPDRRIADRNVDRYERTGHIDTGVLAALGPDAAPALARLPPRLAACVTKRVRRELARPDGLAGLNLGRARAREALRRLPPPERALCVAPAT